MQMLKTYNWSRRDFCFDAECENCKSVKKDISGYDDGNYYENVIPNMICNNCGQSSKMIGSELSAIKTRYNENLCI